jgi:hypothetical protein
MLWFFYAIIYLRGNDMGLISTLLGEDKKKQEPKKEKSLLETLTETKDPDYTEEDLDDYGLTDWEKDEIKKGNQDIWDFEEEDKDDDSYYGEDDD